jgi:hypothetical protein
VGAVAGERDIEEHHAEETPRPQPAPNVQDPNPNAPPETTGSTTGGSGS